MPDTFAHTRAYLSHLSREYQLVGSLADDSSSETDALVKKTVQLLDDEDEDGLKALIAQTYSIDPSAVSPTLVGRKTRVLTLRCGHLGPGGDRTARAGPHAQA